MSSKEYDPDSYQQGRVAALEEAVAAVNRLIGKDSGNWNRAVVYAVEEVRKLAQQAQEGANNERT